MHIIEGSSKLLRDPTQYINEIEHTMSVLGYSIHFSTSTDPCNYLFKKFCPRLTVGIDDESIKASTGLPDALSFTSHANTVWTIYDYGEGGSDVPQQYNENFSIAMFMIIEYLARRRTKKKPGQLFYMNQYLSIPSELGVFAAVESRANGIDSGKMQEEDALFKSMKIDYSPDNNIDRVLEDLYSILKQHKAGEQAPQQ